MRFKRTTNKTEYKYIRRVVYVLWDKEDVKYQANHRKINHFSIHSTAKEAAIALDKVLIEKGMEPINVLTRKLF